MLIGLAGGIVVGAIVGAVTPSCWSVDAYDDDTCGTAASIIGGAFGLGILGAVGGLVVGAIPRARYEEIRTPWAVGD